MRLPILFVQGFFDGVTGIVRKPVEGAKQEGVEGFFKGKQWFNLLNYISQFINREYRK